MSLVDNLKKRSKSRKIFALGSAITFIGFLLPIIKVPDQVKGLKYADVEITNEEEVALTPDEINAAKLAAANAVIEAETKTNFVTDDATIQGLIQTTTVERTIDDINAIAATNEAVKKAIDAVPTTKKVKTTKTERVPQKHIKDITSSKSLLCGFTSDDLSEFDVDSYPEYDDLELKTEEFAKKHPEANTKEAYLKKYNLRKPDFSEYDWKNEIFDDFRPGKPVVKGAASFFNVADSAGGFAHNATFIVILWLMSIAGILVFLCVEGVVLDTLVWLIGAAFGIAALITIPRYLEASLFSFASVGTYIVIIGWVVAFVGVAISLFKLEQQGIRKTL
ncbi:MAG: hypothetical protein IKP49_01775 [Treponema sp.]|nr:hypothetical protein [Treponema sp.]